MTLGIFVKRTRDDDDDDPGYECWAAGFESDRKELWGHPNFKALPIGLLPDIEFDVCIPPEQFDQLLAECDVVESRISRAVDEDPTLPEARWWLAKGGQLARYMRSIREAVTLARETSAPGIDIG